MPDGASPLSINCDYNLGVVFQRPGLESVFTYADAFVEAAGGFTESFGEGVTWVCSPPTPPPAIVGLKFNANSQFVTNFVSSTYDQTGGNQGYLAIIENDNISGINPPPSSINTSVGDVYLLIGSSSDTKCGNYIYFCSNLTAGIGVHMSIDFTGPIDGGRGVILVELTGATHLNTTSKSQDGFVTLDTTNPINQPDVLVLAGGRSAVRVNETPPFQQIDTINNGNIGSMSYKTVASEVATFVSIGGNGVSLFQSVFGTANPAGPGGCSVVLNVDPLAPAPSIVGLKFNADSQSVTSFTSSAYSQTGGNQGYLAVISNDDSAPLSVSTDAGDIYRLVGSSSDTTCANYIYFCDSLVAGASVHMNVDFAALGVGGRGIILLELSSAIFLNNSSKSLNGFGSLSTVNPIPVLNALVLAGGRTNRVNETPPFQEIDTLSNGNVGTLSFKTTSGETSSSVSMNGNGTTLFQSVLAGSTGVSQVLQTLNFKLHIPPNSIPSTTQTCGCGCGFPNELPVFGVEVILSGSQTDISPDVVLHVQLELPDGTLSPTVFTTQMPLAPGIVTVGGSAELWGFTDNQLNATVLNSPNFTVNVAAEAPGGEQVTVNVAVRIRAFISTNPPESFNYLKTFAQQNGDIFSLFLGNSGTMYREDVNNDQFSLHSIYTAIEPNSFAQSCTVDDREFIALSNLINGTDIPYTYDGTNFDRLSQVGPGAAPNASAGTAQIDIVSITQNPAVHPPTSTGGTNGTFILWSESPTDNDSPLPGNVLTFEFPRAYTLPSYIKPGMQIVIQGVQVMDGYDPNNGVGGNPPSYTILGVGQPDPNNDYYDGFWVTLPQSGLFVGHRLAAGATFQATQATLTTSAQLPNVEVGNSISISGTGGAPPAGYDGTWQVLQTPNAAQLQITATELNANVATYSYNLITGTAPTVGQLVTVTGTLNGNGIFNVVNGLIQSTSPGVFSIQINSANVPSAAESGSGIIFGTVFIFDPGQVVGNRTGGELVAVGLIAAGVRKICYSFLTRNGYMTAPSPILTFDVPIGASSLTVGNLLAGPPDVVARVIHITAANGGNFYDIPIPVTVLDNGLPVVNTSTYLNDNTSTSIKLSFSDGVLLAATPVDVEGNNLFATLELGSVLGLIEYASRVFAIGEQNKVPNFLNWSFDGGIVGGGGGQSQGVGTPAGWTVDPTNGSGGSVVTSPIFGWAYQIQNATGSTQATYGMITQPAFQDEFMVPIIQASTTYSTRITAMVSADGASGNLVVDLFSPSFGTSLGAFTVPLASLESRMEIFTGQMLVNKLAPVPNDLLLRIYATNIPDGTTILIDRNEVFPTEQPNLATQVTGSYINNFEAFDESGEGGIVDTAGENPQPVRSAFTLYDTLYLVKTGSLVSTQDNAATEPSGWSIRAVSNSVGTPSIYGVTTGIDEPNTGEAWAVIAGQPGGYIFNGGEPVKITEEIQSLWDLINWRYGHTLWVKNDVKERRLYFAVPMKTQTRDARGNIVQNPWIPEGIIADDPNPTTPNVILMCSYRQLNTGEQLESKVGVHVSYSGRLIASEQTRKWSVWTIKAPAAAFLRRSDTTEPLFLGNSAHNGKIYELVDDWKQDDCHPIIQIYDTYGFVTDEQGQGLRIGNLRKVYTYAVMIVDGTGDLNLRVFPNALTSPYAHDLLPRITLPQMTDGDIEIPVNETANRLFWQFKTDQIGASFALSRLMVATQQDPWSAIRGKNG